MSKSFRQAWPSGAFAARTENELLLLCARTRVGDEESARIKSLAVGSCDWDYLTRLARRHAVLPLLQRSLAAHAGGLVPEIFRLKLRDLFRKNATRNLLLAGELLRVAGLFESEGVLVLAYKGPALAVAAYGDLSLRRFIDADIIVERRDAIRAGELLRSLGFGLQKGLSEAHERVLIKSQHNLAYTRDAGRLTVELHWGIAHEGYARLPLDESVWARARRIKLLGGEVSTLSPEDSLLALCVHGTKHLWERLSWVCDVAELLRSHPHLDFDYTLRSARDSRTDRMLRLGLRLSARLLGATLPAEVVARFAHDTAAERLCDAVVEKLFARAEYKTTSLVGNIGFNLSARPRLLEKARYIRSVVTPTDGDLAAFPLPERLAFMYYLLRPLRLVAKGGGN